VSGPYDVLMVDPPWPVKGHFTETRSIPSSHRPGVGYSTVEWSELWPLLDEEVFSQAAAHHALFLWTLEQYLTDAEKELTARGYRRSSRIIWDKGNGPLTYRLRRSHEFLLWYCKPRLLPASMSSNCKYPSVIRSASRQHSRKPDAAYDIVEALYPEARRLDAFSRERRAGWDAFGDQIDHFSPLFACLREEAI